MRLLPGCSSPPCSEVGGILSGFPAHMFQYLFPALLWSLQEAQRRCVLALRGSLRGLEKPSVGRSNVKMRWLFPWPPPADLNSFSLIFHTVHCISMTYFATGSLYLLISLTYFSPSPNPLDSHFISYTVWLWVNDMYSEPYYFSVKCVRGYRRCWWKTVYKVPRTEPMHNRRSVNSHLFLFSPADSKIVSHLWIQSCILISSLFFTITHLSG